jgi:hypothetical protein
MLLKNRNVEDQDSSIWMDVKVTERHSQTMPLGNDRITRGYCGIFPYASEILDLAAFDVFRQSQWPTLASDIAESGGFPSAYMISLTSEGPEGSTIDRSVDYT